MTQQSDQQYGRMEAKEADSKLTTADLVAGTRPAEKTDMGRTDQATQEQQQDASPTPATASGAARAPSTPLFPGEEAEDFRSRWDDIQTGFVDDPQSTIQQADTLVAEAMKLLAQTFADERSKLEQQWQGGGEVSTEDLRVAFQRYRSFFQRLLSL